ncbi:unnamed protein product [Trichobilharzia regenti]|nr:unnamed protein product [Trichobilharzia regenti]
MHTRKTVTVSDQRVAYLSTYVKAEQELVMKDSIGGNPTFRQPSKCRTATASDAPLSSSTCVTQSSLVKGKSWETSILWVLWDQLMLVNGVLCVQRGHDRS